MTSYLMFIILCFFLVIINLIFLYKASLKKDSVLGRFSDKIRFLPGIFVAISAILTYNIFLITIKQNGRDTTFKMVDRGWIILNKEIHDSYDKCPTFINSLFGKPPHPDVTDSWVSVYYLSNLIFQAIEDVLTSMEADESDQSGWINIFMQFSSSRLLYKQWKHYKNYYSPTTQRLGDLIFKYGLKTNPNNFRGIEKATTELMNEDEYKEIIRIRHSS